MKSTQFPMNSSLFCCQSESSNRSVLALPVRAVRRSFSKKKKSFVVSNHSCTTFCWSVSEVNNSITEYLIVLSTPFLCFDQTYFINCVGMPLVMNVRSALWLPTLSEQVLHCVAGDARREKAAPPQGGGRRQAALPEERGGQAAQLKEREGESSTTHKEEREKAPPNRKETAQHQ